MQSGNGTESIERYAMRIGCRGGQFPKIIFDEKKFRLPKSSLTASAHRPPTAEYGSINKKTDRYVTESSQHAFNFLTHRCTGV